MIDVPDRLPPLRRECEHAPPLPPWEELRAGAQQALDWVCQHHATLAQQPVGRNAPRAELEALLGRSAPEHGQDFAKVLAEFAAKVAPNSCRVDHPRFLAFIPSAPTLVSILGDLLCAGTNFFAGVWVEAASAAYLEAVVLDWFRSWLGLPPGTLGVLTSGGSEANLTALAVAREPLSDDERHRAVLYVGQQRHWSIDRAAKVLGLRPHQVRNVGPCDDRLTAGLLAERVARDRAEGHLPWAVAACAGATNTGAVDPLGELADLCWRERLWLHVDAAYGWTAVLTPKGKAALAGVERADSVTFDPHKWLAQTYGVGGVLVRDGAALTRTFAMRPDYMQDVEPGAEEVNFADHGIALTRPFRALKVWLSIQALGVGWFRRLVAHGLALARYAEALLRREGFEVLSPAQLSIVCFRHVPAGFPVRGEEDERELDRRNLALVDAVRATQQAFLSSTQLRGRVALRFCFVN